MSTTQETQRDAAEQGVNVAMYAMAKLVGDMQEIPNALKLVIITKMNQVSREALVDVALKGVKVD